MSDVFLSYSSADRARATQLQRTLAAEGYDVFWDQSTPPGEDWDSWIRAKLAKAKVVIVLWSRTSVQSPNVRHEAMIARDQGKLVPVLIEPLQPTDFPMGLYLVQSLSLASWSGNAGAEPVQRLLAELAARLERSAQTQPPARPVQRGATDVAKQGATAPRRWMIGAIGLVLVAILAGGYAFLDQTSRSTSAAWTAVPSNDAAALRAFIAGNPGQYRDDAQTALAELEELSFEAASDADTVEAFEGFLNDFPDSEHAIVARGRRAELQSVEPPSDEPLPPSDDPDLLPPGSPTN